MSVLSQELNLEHFLTHRDPVKKKPASIIFNWISRSGSTEISGKVKQTKDGRNFSYLFLTPLSLVSDGGE